MVVTGSIDRAISYFSHPGLPGDARAPTRRSSPSPVSTRSAAPCERSQPERLPVSKIADRIRDDPYRFLVCADKFQTGYDEPLLHTMYVDKRFPASRPCRRSSRLNRAHPQKHDTIVLDFRTIPRRIRRSFADYYRTTILSDETDPNKLHDLKADLDDATRSTTRPQVDGFGALYLAERSPRPASTRSSTPVWPPTTSELDEDGQVDFKGKAKAFVRTYGFLAAILPYTNAAWEKLSIFLNFLIPKLPAPKEEDLTRRASLETIDMDSYRVEKQATKSSCPTRRRDRPGADACRRPPEPELDLLSNIVKTFNDLFGNIPWADADRIGAHLRGHPGEGHARRRLPECQEKLGQTKCPD